MPLSPQPFPGRPLPLLLAALLLSSLAPAAEALATACTGCTVAVSGTPALSIASTITVTSTSTAPSAGNTLALYSGTCDAGTPLTATSTVSAVTATTVTFSYTPGQTATTATVCYTQNAVVYTLGTTTVKQNGITGSSCSVSGATATCSGGSLITILGSTFSTTTANNQITFSGGSGTSPSCVAYNGTTASQLVCALTVPIAAGGSTWSVSVTRTDTSTTVVSDITLRGNLASAPVVSTVENCLGDLGQGSKSIGTNCFNGYVFTIWGRNFDVYTQSNNVPSFTGGSGNAPYCFPFTAYADSLSTYIACTLRVPPGTTGTWNVLLSVTGQTSTYLDNTVSVQVQVMATDTITNTYTRSVTLTRSTSVTPSPTATNTLTPSTTLTPTPTNTETRTRSATATQTNTPTQSSTPTSTRSSTATATETGTGTLTATGTRTATATGTHTATATPTATPTGTDTATRSSTATATATGTATSSDTPTETGTGTRTGTATATRTSTSTASETATRSETATPTSTETATLTTIPTYTGTPTPTQSLSPTATATPTPSPSGTITETLELHWSPMFRTAVDWPVDQWTEARKLQFIEALRQFLQVNHVPKRSEVVIDALNANTDATQRRNPSQTAVSWRVLYIGLGTFHERIMGLVPDRVQPFEDFLAGSGIPVLRGQTGQLPEPEQVACHMCSPNLDPLTMGIAQFQCSYALGGRLLPALSGLNLQACP